MISLAIDMIVLKSLNDKSFYLKCMCGTEFVFVKGEFNCSENTAQCPKCKAIWTGHTKVTEAVEEYTTHYYLVCGKFKDPKLQERHKDTEGVAPLCSGKGVDMLHFMSAWLPKLELDCMEWVKIIEITKEYHEKALIAIRSMSLHSLFDFITEGFMEKLRGKPE